MVLIHNVACMMMAFVLVMMVISMVSKTTLIMSIIVVMAMPFSIVLF